MVTIYYCGGGCYFKVRVGSEGCRSGKRGLEGSEQKEGRVRSRAWLWVRIVLWRFWETAGFRGWKGVASGGWSFTYLDCVVQRQDVYVGLAPRPGDVAPFSIYVTWFGENWRVKLRKVLIVIRNSVIAGV